MELDRLDELSDDEVRTRLVAVSGIGRWSADMFLLRQLHRPDVFPAGDLGLRKAVQLLDGLDRTPTEKEAEARAERWRPYRSLAARYVLWWLYRARTAESARRPGSRAAVGGSVRAFGQAGAGAA